MKKLLIAISVLGFSMAAMPAYAERGVGVGVIIGEPTGLSAKVWTSPSTAVALAAAWSFSGRDAVHFHADYLLHNFKLLGPPELPVYYGLGSRLKLRGGKRSDDDDDGDILLGVRVPVGIAYHFPGAPIDIFVEIAPILDLVPDTDFSLNAALGARFYF